MGQQGDPEYITVSQLTVVETLLLGLRKKCATDYYTTFIDGYLKVESTKVLLDAGYTLLDRVDTNANSALQLTAHEITGAVVALPVPIMANFRKQEPCDIITLKPAVHIALQCVSEHAQFQTEDLERGLERLCTSQINALIVACGELVYDQFQEQFPNLVPQIANLQPYFSDSPQRYTSTSGEFKNEEFTFRACRAPTPNGAASRIVFAVLRPNALQKQVEKLLEVALTLEQDKVEMTDDTEVLTDEIESLKAELEKLNSERDAIQGGSGEFEAERDLLKEERNEVVAERDALKVELVSLKKEMHELELELEAMKDIRNKTTYLSDDDDDKVDTSSHKVDESLEVGLDDDDEDEDLKVVASLEDAEDELEESSATTTTIEAETSGKKKSITILDDEDEDEDVVAAEATSTITDDEDDDEVAVTSAPPVVDDDGDDSDDAVTAVTPTVKHEDVDEDVDEDADDFVQGKVVYTSPPKPEEGEADKDKDGEDDGGDSSDWSDGDN